MEPNTTNTIKENEPIEEIDVETTEAAESIEATGERPRGRGRRGMGGRRPFGPNRPYRFALFLEEDGSYVLRSPDLAADAVPVASLDEVGATMRAAIEERAAEDAAAAEEAVKDADYSGKFVLRLPRSMHRQLSELAEAEGVSLNQLALAFLAEGMGRMDMAQEFGERRGRHRGPRGGRGPGGHGPEGHGPRGRGPRGDRGPEGRGPRGFDRGGPDRFDSRPDCKDRTHRGFATGRHGHKEHGFRRPRWFTGEADAAPNSPEPNETSFV
jgi:antitoxin HicB